MNGHQVPDTQASVRFTVPRLLASCYNRRVLTTVTPVSVTNSHISEVEHKKSLSLFHLAVYSGDSPGGMLPDDSGAQAPSALGTTLLGEGLANFFCKGIRE